MPLESRELDELWTCQTIHVGEENDRWWIHNGGGNLICELAKNEMLFSIPYTASCHLEKNICQEKCAFGLQIKSVFLCISTVRKVPWTPEQQGALVCQKPSCIVLTELTSTTAFSNRQGIHILSPPKTVRSRHSPPSDLLLFNWTHTKPSQRQDLEWKTCFVEHENEVDGASLW